MMLVKHQHKLSCWCTN